MTTTSNDPPEGYLDFVFLLMTIAGQLCLLLALPFGIFIPLDMQFREHWDLTWSLILGTTITVTLAVAGGFFTLLARLFWWLKITSWSSRDRKSDNMPG